MSPCYLPEYVENAQLALALAKKQAAHLAYTHDNLFAQPIDIKWVEALLQDESRAEKIDAFVGRFGRLQDYMGEKLLPRFAKLLGESPKSLLDVLAYAEKSEWLNDASEFINARKLRNQLIHEYMTHAELFLEALLLADNATLMLIEVVKNIEQLADSLGLMQNAPDP